MKQVRVQKKKKERKNIGVFVVVILLSMFSGMGNALVIFSINYSIALSNSERLKMVPCLLIGLFLYIFGQKVVRSKLILMSNQMISEQRKNLIMRWLGARYEKIEQIGNEKFQATVNNDTEVVSNFVNVLVSGITSFITMVCCFVYLFILNKLALLMAVGVIVLIAAVYYVFGEYANKINDGARDLQNEFFAFMNDLLLGVKELMINDKKKKEFEEEIQGICDSYRDKRVQSGNIYANLFILGELLFTIAIAIIAFAFPFILHDLKTTELSSYIFILLYLTGPINSLLDAIPGVMNIKISSKRIQSMLNELDTVVDETKKRLNFDGEIELTLEDVEYCYIKDGEITFQIGPINASFRSGEITFITGGNGSGKSTFAKMILGLYQKTKGEIRVNGEIVNERELSELYTSVFSDFHLFHRLYGIDCEKKKEEINEYIHFLGLQDKLHIVDGKFSTIDLSTGQKKRLALLISLIEDKQIYLFDEWAADQDPYFRKYFYEVILLELKKRGKCVIAITHDDRYFSIADKNIKFEMGQVYNINKVEESYVYK